MSAWRAPLRLALVVGATTAVLVPVLVLILLGLLPALAVGAGSASGPMQRLDALALRALLGVQRLWCRALLVILGVRLRVVGPCPEPGALLVANHLSYLDIPVLGAVTACRFVAKSEVAGWPVVGVLARSARVLFVDRGRRKDVVRVGTLMRRTLDAGVAVALFPEGTSSRGEAVLPFHPGLMQPAAEAGIACRAVAIRYETPDDPEAPACTICWWGDMTFTPHVWNLMKIPRIEATLHFAPEAVRDADRKRLAAELHARVTAAFRPVRQQARDATLAAAGTVVLP